MLLSNLLLVLALVKDAPDKETNTSLASNNKETFYQSVYTILYKHYFQDTFDVTIEASVIYREEN